jgi:branched-chain amino acid transport system substrate-binding protein
MKFFSSMFLSLILTLVATVSTGKDLPKIAVWDLNAGNINPSYAQDLTSILVSEISKVGKYEVYSQENVRTLAGWTAERMQLGCTDTKCLTALGQMDIAKLISGRVGNIGNTYSISLNLFDTQNARAEKAVSDFCRTEDELIPLIQNTVRKLLGEEVTPSTAEDKTPEKETITATSKPIKLGAIFPLADITGDQGAKAMKLAVKEINKAGGLLGRQVELIVIDDEMKPEKGAAAVEKLATVDKVDVLLGGMASGVHLGQIPIMKKYEKVTVWMGAASSRCEQAVGSAADWYFHLHPWDYQQGAGYQEGWTDINKKRPEVKIEKWFMAYEEGPFGTASYKAYEALYKDYFAIEGKSFKSAALGGGDYRIALRRAKEAKPDIFVWVGYDADALSIMEQSKEVGFVPPIYNGSPPGWPAHFGKSHLAEGVTLYGIWAPSINKVSAVSKHFWEAYINEYKQEPATYFAPLAYTNVYFVAEGIKRAQTLQKAVLIKAIEETKYVSPIGETLIIKPSKIIKHQGFTKQKILQWQKGVQHVIWPFEFSTSQLAYPFPSWEKR